MFANPAESWVDVMCYPFTSLRIFPIVLKTTTRVTTEIRAKLAEVGEELGHFAGFLRGMP